MNLLPFDGDYIPTPYLWADSGLGASCSTTGGIKLSAGQIQSLLRQAGWPENLVLTMSAIVLRESAGGWTGAVNACGSEHSVGLAQINIAPSLGRPWSESQLKDPLFNLQVAKQIYDQAGGSFRPWGAWTDGHYRDWLSQATAAYSSGGNNADASAANGISYLPADIGGGAGISGLEIALLVGAVAVGLLLFD